jgi:coenzyme F420-0:L-glutamate ligase/coenzyme F420-1:gamma-L-glutamate ligase
VTARLEVVGVEGIPEVVAGDDLAALTVRHVPGLADGDVVVVTSKVVSKAEGRTVHADREAVIAQETTRVVARRGPTTIARTRTGLTLAAAGVDASNTEPGTVVPLPVDPDGSARGLRSRLRALTGRNVAVVVSDTAGRPWREGQTDIAVGCAGLAPLDDHAGRRDAQGNELAVTAPAVADEVAGAADLVMGKLSGLPVALVRGLAHRVLPAGEHGPGAAALVRPESRDMFVLGAREAVLAAVCRDDPQAVAVLTGAAPTEAGDGVETVRGLLTRVAGVGPSGLEVTALEGGVTEVRGPDDLVTAAVLERLCALAVLSGWQVVADERNSGHCRIVVRTGPGGP